jgi:uncharacterized protein YaiL (DUF2058 family)
MSLRDELLKAGLVPSEQAKKRDSDARRQEHQRKKNKALGPRRRHGARKRASGPKPNWPASASRIDG